MVNSNIDPNHLIIETVPSHTVHAPSPRRGRQRESQYSHLAKLSRINYEIEVLHEIIRRKSAESDEILLVDEESLVPIWKGEVFRP